MFSFERGDAWTRGDDISIRQRVDQAFLSAIFRPPEVDWHFWHLINVAKRIKFMDTTSAIAWVSQSQASQIPRSHDEILP